MTNEPVPAPGNAAAATRSRRRARNLRLLLLGFGTLLALIAVEVAFHLAPGLLPTRFRMRYPPNGVEFFTPGVLDRVPVTELPLPYGVTAYDGPPPYDLAQHGLAPMSAVEIDRTKVPRLVLPADVDGLPNRQRPEHPDVVLVGDSFTLLAGQEEPPGLQRGLERDLPATCLNLGISGIGPDHELFLLRRLGLPRKPKLVIWFYYGGNDAIDTFWLRLNQKNGAKTMADLFAERRAPRLILPSLLWSFFQSDLDQSTAERAPPFTLAAAPSVRMWFYPNTLRILCLPPKVLLDNPGWHGVAEVMRDLKQETERAGVPLLVVYLPSKPEVYLPYIQQDAELLRRSALAATYSLPMADTAEQFLADLLLHRNAQEQAMRDLCAHEGIEMWSAKPPLDAMARDGKLGYYATDTHWCADGQLAVLPALIERVRQMGLFPK